MAQIHTLHVPEYDRSEADPEPEKQPEGQLVALPFIDLATVVKSMKMLRKFPDQSVLDNFNCAKPDTPSA